MEIISNGSGYQLQPLDGKKRKCYLKSMIWIKNQKSTTDSENTSPLAKVIQKEIKMGWYFPPQQNLYKINNWGFASFGVSLQSYYTDNGKIKTEWRVAHDFTLQHYQEIFQQTSHNRSNTDMLLWLLTPINISHYVLNILVLYP